MADVITNDGKDVVLNRTFNNTPTLTEPKYFIASADSVVAAASDSTYDIPLFKSSTTIDALDATTGWAAAGDGGTIALNSTVGEFKEGTGCLNIPSTYSSGTSTFSKTIGSTDLSSQWIAIWFYVTATTNMASGSDSFALILGTSGFTNYNQYNIDKSEISAGWNLFVFEVDSPDSTGGSGATETTIDRVRVQVKTTADFTTNNMRIDFIHYAAESDFLISFAASYPVFDTVNDNVKIRGTIESTQMNDGTPPINKIYVVNNDATKLVFSIHNLNSSIDKTSKTRLTFTETTEF